MSVFGVDLGTLHTVVSIPRAGGVDVIINDVSKRETATVVALGDEERHIGETGADRLVRNTNQTASVFKSFVGARAGDAHLPSNRRFLFCPTTEDADGRIMFHMEYNGGTVDLYPEQLLAMLFGQLQKYVNVATSLDAKPGMVVGEVKDCVVTAPAWYTAEQRRLLIQACEIRGVNCMSIINETTSACLEYGIFRNASLPEKEDDGTIVALVDIGYAGTTITITKFWRGNMRVIAHTWDEELGTREVDYYLFNYFADEIKKKYRVDPRENKRARVRLLAACDKVKYTLSANSTAQLSIDNLMDVDVIIPNFERKSLEALVAPLGVKMQELCTRALENVGIPKEKIASVEMVGGGCRIPFFKAAVGEAFGKTPSFTLNASESVAKGAAITAAVFSPKFQVREYVVNEVCVFPIMMGYYSDKATAVSSVSFLPAINKVITVLRKGDSYPKVLEYTFERSDEFDLYIFYDDTCEEIVKRTGGRLLLGQWKVGKTDKKTTEEVKVRVRIQASGLVSVEAASATEKYEVDEVEEKKDAADPTKPAEKVTVKKEKTRRVDLTVTPKFFLGHSAEVMLAAKKLEAEMTARDAAILRRKDAKNDLEACVYDNRSRFEAGGNYLQYVKPADAAEFLRQAKENEAWLYGDGETATLEEYQSRLDKMNAIRALAAKRFKLADDLPYSQRQCSDKLAALRDQAIQKIGKAAHITEEELRGAAVKCDEAIEWIRQEMSKYAAAPKCEDSSVTPESFEARVKEVENQVKLVVNRPPPPPPKPEPKPEPKTATPTEAKPASPADQAPKPDPKKADAQPGQKGPEISADMD